MDQHESGPPRRQIPPIPQSAGDSPTSRPLWQREDPPKTNEDPPKTNEDPPPARPPQRSPRSPISEPGDQVSPHSSSFSQISPTPPPDPLQPFAGSTSQSVHGAFLPRPSAHRPEPAPRDPSVPTPKPFSHLQGLEPKVQDQSPSILPPPIPSIDPAKLAAHAAAEADALHGGGHTDPVASGGEALAAPEPISMFSSPTPPPTSTSLPGAREDHGSDTGAHRRAPAAGSPAEASSAEHAPAAAGRAELELTCSALSAGSRAVEMLLIEAGVPYTRRAASIWWQPHDAPQAMSLEPFHAAALVADPPAAFPLLRAAAPPDAPGAPPLALAEPLAILRFLCARAPGAPALEPWYPAEPRARARVDELLEWNTRTLHAACRGVLASALGVARVAAGSKVRAELARHAAAVLEGAAAMEARWLSARGGGFLASEHAPTIADIVVICDLETVSPRPAPPRPSPRSCAAGTAYTPRGTKVEFFAPDFSHLPALERWRARMRGRPAFAAVSHDLWVTTRGLLAGAPREATRAEPPRRCAQELPRER